MIFWCGNKLQFHCKSLFPHFKLFKSSIHNVIKIVSNISKNLMYMYVI